MKKILLQTVTTIAFLTLLLCCFVKLSNLMQRKESNYKYRPFYEQQEDFDVLFMGTSHVINAVFPMELWKDYGIVSYNFGGHGNMMPTTYWVLMNALEHTNPKLVVIDVLEVGQNDKVPVTVEQTRLSLDSIPLSLTKYKAVTDLFDGDENEVDAVGERKGSKWEYLVDFGKYHTRWNDLTEQDFDKEYKTVEKGAEIRINVDEPDAYELVDKNATLGEDTVGMKYLRMMIEECQKRGIDVLLTHDPYPSSEWQQLSANMVYALAEEYGVEYLNYVAMDDVVDYGTDCYDKHSHLNASGGKKVTKKLGEAIVRGYAVPDRREDPAYASWQEDLITYQEQKLNQLQKEKNLYNTLMLLADDDYDSIVCIREGSNLMENEKVLRLLNNMAPFTKDETYVGEGTGYLQVTEHENGSCKSYTGMTDGLLTLETKMGQFVYGNNPDGYRCLVTPGDGVNHLEDYLQHYEEGGWGPEPDIHIFVYDSKTGEFLYDAYWQEETEETQEKLN